MVSYVDRQVVVMSVRDSPPKNAVKPFSGRRQVSRRIVRFSALIGIAGSLLTAFAYIASAYPLLLHWREVNLHALSEIDCVGVTCDSSTYSTDSRWDDPDYVVDTETGFFIDVANSTAAAGRFPQLDYSDPNFVAKFRRPMLYNTPDGEVWRLYSREVPARGHGKLEIIVGYAVNAPSKAITTPDSLIGDVDVALIRAVDEISWRLSGPTVAVRLPRSAFSADGFQVVDPNTKEVVEQGPWVPAFLPRSALLPAPGVRFYIYQGGFYVAQTDTKGRLLATSFVQIGGLWWIACWSVIGFLCASATARWLSRRLLRNYFAVTGVRVPNLEEARRAGEGQSVEFKRGLSDDENRTGSVEDELLKSIAAFANTNDGVILIGIDDAGHVKGIGLDFKQKDRLERKIHQLVRNRIRPAPPVQVTFEDVHGLPIAKIVVARGEAPAYMIGGIIYVRCGSSDVQAQPEDVLRLVSQHSF